MKTKSNHALAASNIKRELTRAFPGINFRVKSKSYSMGCSVTAHWELGPTSKEVDALIDKYQDGDFDGMTDSYTYRNREERSNNGSAKYVFSSRSMPDGLHDRVCRDIAALQGVELVSTWQKRENGSLGLSDYANRVLSQTSFPAGAEYIGVEHGFELTLTGCCAADKTYRIIHSKTDENAEMREVIKREFDWIKQQEDQRAIQSFDALYAV